MPSLSCLSGALASCWLDCLYAIFRTFSMHIEQLAAGDSWYTQIALVIQEGSISGLSLPVWQLEILGGQQQHPIENDMKFQLLSFVVRSVDGKKMFRSSPTANLLKGKTSRTLQTSSTSQKFFWLMLRLFKWISSQRNFQDSVVFHGVRELNQGKYTHGRALPYRFSCSPSQSMDLLQ